MLPVSSRYIGSPVKSQYGTGIRVGIVVGSIDATVLDDDSEPVLVVYAV
jgi:hypothetical protein